MKIMEDPLVKAEPSTAKAALPSNYNFKKWQLQLILKNSRSFSRPGQPESELNLPKTRTHSLDKCTTNPKKYLTQNNMDNILNLLKLCPKNFTSNKNIGSKIYLIN